MLKSIYRRIYTPNVQILVGPLAIITVTAILFILVAKNGYLRINKQLNVLKTTRATERILESKINALKEINQNILDKSDITLINLPNKNSGILMFSQVKDLGVKSGIQINDLETGNLKKLNDDISSIQIKVEGNSVDFASLINFLEGLNKVAPVANIGNVKVSTIDSGVLESVTEVNTFWSKLPTELPPLTQPIKLLTQEEEIMLSQISTNVLPNFATLNQEEPKDRENPFR